MKSRMRDRTIGLDNKVTKIKSRYKLVILLVESEKINANACVVSMKNKNFIFINKDLPKELITFVFFHEIAHLRTKVGLGKYKKYNIYVEQLMNFIALCCIRKLISRKAFIYSLALGLSTFIKTLFSRTLNFYISQELSSLMNHEFYGYYTN